MAMLAFTCFSILRNVPALKIIGQLCASSILLFLWRRYFLLVETSGKWLF